MTLGERFKVLLRIKEEGFEILNKYWTDELGFSVKGAEYSLKKWRIF